VSTAHHEDTVRESTIRSSQQAIRIKVLPPIGNNCRQFCTSLVQSLYYVPDSYFHSEGVPDRPTVASGPQPYTLHLSVGPLHSGPVIFMCCMLCTCSGGRLAAENMCRFPYHCFSDCTTMRYRRLKQISMCREVLLLDDLSFYHVTLLGDMSCGPMSTNKLV
jgi:hypothetical protein